MRTARISLTWTLLLIGATLPIPAQAPDKRAMTIVDLLEVPRLGDPQLSPDGSQLLYVLATADWDANERIAL